MRLITNEELFAVAGGLETDGYGNPVYCGVDPTNDGYNGVPATQTMVNGALVAVAEQGLTPATVPAAPSTPTFTNCVAQQVCTQALAFNGQDDTFSIPAAVVNCLTNANPPADPSCSGKNAPK